MNVNNKIYSTTSKALKLNESAEGKEKYILEGIFAELGVMNVNHRIYTESEYLRHLQYLREDVKRGDLLGELDHPDIFETKLNNASHRIIDIWYEPQTKMVMGKIELLSTPKGEIAKRLVDDGVPLHISSRAAGTVNKDNTVSIQQIYTYDLVAKPGFAKATLHRVNESANATEYPEEVINFLKESEEMENKNAINNTLLEEGFYTDGRLVPSALRKEAVEILENKNEKIDMKELTKHINEEANEAQEDTSAASAAAAGVPSADMSLEPTNEDDKEEDKKKDVSEVDNKDDKEEEKKEDKKDDEKDEDDDYEILDVKAFEEGDDDDSKKEEEDSDESDEKQDDDNKEEAKEEETKKNEEESSEAKTEKEATEANKLFDKKEELKARNDKFSEQFENLVNRIKTKNKVTESAANELHTLYPFTAYMSESSFVEFSKLSDNKKRKVRDYLMESSVTNPGDIDYVWRNGLVENFNSEPVWLQKASQEYRDLYYGASAEKQHELSECAKYLNFYTQSDIDSFWRNSDLKTQKEKQLMYEAYVNSIPKIAQKTDEELMPYSMENVMKMVDAYC